MEHPALDHLMGAYLHQDFDLFGPSPMAAVDAFIRDEPDLGRALPTEIEELLAARRSDSEVKAALEEMGCQIQVNDADGGYRRWLEAIAEQARGH